MNLHSYRVQLRLRCVRIGQCRRVHCLPILNLRTNAKRLPHLRSLQLVMHVPQGNLKYLWKVKYTDIEMMTQTGELCPSFRLFNITRANTCSIPHLHSVTSCVYLVFQYVAFRQMIFDLR